ncbi:hypothetical protein HN587_02470 [Candidatus Woesearchaeota archaeon]|jgi:hypothetical protein|nr:hypothetical protein [Candidatus Woesearchaeota archaeon]
MTKDTIDLLLDEVKTFDPTKFSSCRVHYDGIVGKGRDWEHKSVGSLFEYEITPQQANLLSKLNGVYGGWKLSVQEQSVLEGIPQELVGRWRDQTHVTMSSQFALYDLLN